LDRCHGIPSMAAEYVARDGAGEHGLMDGVASRPWWNGIAHASLEG
jgi:hypothetical protein